MRIAGVARLLAFGITLSVIASPRAVAAPLDPAAIDIHVDFAAAAGPPLVKKFGLMNSGLVPIDRYRRDLPKLAALKAESLRVDLSIGKTSWLGNLIGGTPAALQYEWTGIDELASALAVRGVTPYWSFCYTPRPLQGAEGWRGVPNDLTQWGAAAETFARHFRESRLHVGYYEVWNEPDFREFLRASRDDYFAMYDVASRAFRRGDPDAVVGGPSIAFLHNWMKPFVAFVDAHDLPLDFFSFHSIGGPADGPSKELFALDGLKAARAALAKISRFRATDIHLNEYHPYYGALADQTDSPALAARLFADFAMFLDWTDLTVVSWAQFMDAGVVDRYGLIDIDGKERPAYRAFAIYGEMPIDRVLATVRCRDDSNVADAHVGCLASADPSRAACVIWNDGSEARDVDVSLEHVAPTIAGKWSIERIPADADTSTLPTFDGSSTTWHGQLAAGSIIYFTRGSLPITDPAAGADRADNLKIVRVQRLFPADRGGTQYAFFDPATDTARLGTGASPHGPAVLAITLDDAPDVIALKAEIDLQSTPPSRASIRVDFRNREGKYVSAIEYRNADAASPRHEEPPPWGTGRSPDELRNDPTHFATLRLNIRDLAPADWDGRVIVTASLDEDAPNARMKLFFKGQQR